MSVTPNSNRKIPIKLIIIGFILGLFFIVFYMGLSNDQTHLQGKQRDIPKFSMPLLNDPKGTLSNADFGQKPVLVSIWASWCAPCRNEHKVLLKLQKEYGLTIYGIDYKDSFENGLAFLTQYGNPFEKVAIDEKGILALEWGISGVPETFIVSKDKKILFKHQGELTIQHLPEFIKKLEENGFEINK